MGLLALLLEISTGSSSFPHHFLQIYPSVFFIPSLKLVTITYGKTFGETSATTNALRYNEIISKFECNSIEIRIECLHADNYALNFSRSLEESIITRISYIIFFGLSSSLWPITHDRSLLIYLFMKYCFISGPFRDILICKILLGLFYPSLFSQYLLYPIYKTIYNKYFQQRFPF